MTEMLAAPDQVLLGSGIAQHYYFVIRRLSGAGNQPVELGAILPDDGQEQPIRLVGVVATEITVGEETQPANRYELDIGTSRHIVWAARTDGRILKVEVPDLRWTSVRQRGN